MSTLSKKRTVTSVTVLLITAVCLAAVCMPTQAAASGPANMRPERSMDGHTHYRSALGIWKNPQIIQKLGLTEEQVKQLRDAYFSARGRELDLNSQLGSFRLKLEKTMAADTIDDKTVLKVAKKIADLKGKQFVHEIESNLSVGKILTADQLSQLKMISESKKKQGAPSVRRYLPSRYAL